jgi:hypothetical protein
LVSVIVLIGVVWNLPESEVKRRLAPILRPVASAVGLEQSWKMYAPEPIRRFELLEVHVTMADGTDRVWTDWRANPASLAPSWYRWQKLKEQAPREPSIQAGLAHWVTRRLTSASEHPVRVQIILRTEDLPPPGGTGPMATGVETVYNEVLDRRP